MEKKRQRAKAWKEKQTQQEPAPTPDHLPHSQWREIKTLLAWEAPGRPFRKRSKEYFITAFLLVMVIQFILFLFSQYLLMLVVFSLLFLSYALASIPPRAFAYQISTEGIRIENHFYIWDELYDFFILKEHGQDTIYVRTKLFYPGELTIMPENLEETKKILARYLPFREYVEPSLLQKSGEWLEKNFPLEKSAR